MRRVLLASGNIGFGTLVTLGSLLELLNLLFPSLLPQLQVGPIAELHRQPVVHAWVLASNFVTLLAAPPFAVAGVGIWLRRPWAARLGRNAAKAILAAALGGIVVCALWMLPPLFRTLPDPALHAQSLALILTIGSAMLFMPLYPAIAHFALGRAGAATMAR